jgi:hypothetical protein
MMSSLLNDDGRVAGRDPVTLAERPRRVITRTADDDIDRSVLPIPIDADASLNGPKRC